MRKSFLLPLVFMVFVFSHSLRAQDKTPPTASSAPGHYYRLTFTVEQVGANGAIQNSRKYTAVMDTKRNDSGMIRTGTKVPLKTSTSGTTVQFQYIDTGINIDASHVEEVNSNQLAAFVTAEISSFSLPTQAEESHSAPNQPWIRQNTWKGQVIVPIGKPTIIFSSDNLDNKGKMQVELTATRIE